MFLLQMMIGVFMLAFCFFLFFSSLHSLILMLLIEFMVLLVFYKVLGVYYNWVNCLMFLLVAVCVGAYGVSLLVSISRDKGGFYLLSFFYL
nr:NADH dehydrogenase subunit 4L [Lardoglyphus konoi]